jgi:hypothetical protein
MPPHSATGDSTVAEGPSYEPSPADMAANAYGHEGTHVVRWSREEASPSGATNASGALPGTPEREAIPSMLDATRSTAESLTGPQLSPTHHDRMVALQVFEREFDCICGGTVLIAWDWKRQEAVSLVRVAGHGGKFQVTLPVGGDYTCRGKGLATFFGWGGTHVRHACPGPKPRPEVDPATLPALGFIGGSTVDEARSAQAFAHPEEWGRVDCRTLRAGDAERRKLAAGRRIG